jgi:UDP-N-acetylglucosamine 2-epimerase (non-hydrolysing)
LKKYKLILVAGARPNFMKIAPIIRALSAESPSGIENKNAFHGVNKEQRANELSWKLVHTGQHYDYEMSQAFFDDLEIPKPDYFLEAGSGSHAEQTARIMTSFEKVCERERPDVVIVVGDVNSTLACSIVAKKLLIKVAHVEAGLRSFDLTMPEEINRMVTDAITDYFFVTEQSAVDNLRKEGKPEDRIFFVGHVMIDTLFFQLEKLEKVQGSGFRVHPVESAIGSTTKGRIQQGKDPAGNEPYALVTLHRPSNVDDRDTLSGIIDALVQISRDMPIFFPMHPRTKNTLESFHLMDKIKGEKFELLPPLPYMRFLSLWKDATLVLTDSGGLQEETTTLMIPCFTIRDNTERPVTLEEGTNTLVGTSKDGILSAYQTFKDHGPKKGQVPELWDGKAAERIVESLIR